jgi:DNA-binding NarL/FixJ family response regulator
MQIETPIRVLLADDFAPIRRLLAQQLPSSELVVVGEAANGTDAIREVAAVTPDVVLMDYRMPGVDGLTATRLIKRDPHAPGIVLYTDTALTSEFVEEALAAGVDQILAKGCRLHEIAAALRAVAQGRIGHYYHSSYAA